MGELTVRCGMYKEGKLVDYYDFTIDGIERNLEWFEGAVHDEAATMVRIVLYKDGRRVTAWSTPVDELFDEFMESVVDRLIDERFMCEVENVAV